MTYAYNVPDVPAIRDAFYALYGVGLASWYRCLLQISVSLHRRLSLLSFVSIVAVDNWPAHRPALVGRGVVAVGEAR